MDNDGGATSWLAAYSQYWSRDVEDVQYYKTMIHFLLAGRSVSACNCQSLLTTVYLVLLNCVFVSMG